MWKHNDKIIENINEIPDNTVGFVYEILHKPSGKKYIGKKLLYFTRSKRLGKKEYATLKEERKKKGIPGKTPVKKVVVIESDWKSYYGSNKELLKLVKEGKAEDFERKIIKFVPSKKLLTYYENKFLFSKGVLENDNYFNDNIESRYYRKDFEL